MVWREVIAQLQPVVRLLPVRVRRVSPNGNVILVSTSLLAKGTRVLRKLAQICLEARNEVRRMFPDTLPIGDHGEVWFTNDGGDIVLLMGIED